MDEIKGTLRALVPAVVAYAVGRGWIPASSAADATAVILALGAVGWSVYDKRKAAKVASVAAMPGTVVSDDGRTIRVVDSSLAAAARQAATDSTGK